MPGAYLNSFSHINLLDLISIISSSKSASCLLDPVPTRLHKDVFPLVNAAILNQINLSLVTGYVPQTFKVAVINPLLKKPSLDPEVLANYRPISNLPYISKILEKVDCWGTHQVIWSPIPPHHPLSFPLAHIELLLSVALCSLALVSCTLSVSPQIPPELHSPAPTATSITSFPLPLNRPAHQDLPHQFIISSFIISC